MTAAGINIGGSFATRKEAPDQWPNTRAPGSGASGRHGIVPALAPRVASAHPAHGHPPAATDAMNLDGLQGVGGTTGGIAATAERPEQRRLKGREHPAINPDTENANMLSRVHCASDKSLPWRNAARRSRSTQESVFPTIEARATSTNATGSRRSYWCRR